MPEIAQTRKSASLLYSLSDKNGANWTVCATIAAFTQTANQQQSSKNCDFPRLLYRNGRGVKREWADAMCDPYLPSATNGHQVTQSPSHICGQISDN